jgi:hypothetical protein
MITYGKYSKVESISLIGTVLIDSVQGGTLDQVTIDINKPGAEVVHLDWGNGTIIALNQGDYAYTSNYAVINHTNTIKIYDNLNAIKGISIVTESTVNCSLNQLKKCKGIENITLTDIKQISGSINGLPSGLKVLELYTHAGINPMTITGSTDNLPASVIEVGLIGVPTGIGGNIGLLKEGLQIFKVSGPGYSAQDWSGLLDNLPSTLVRFDALQAYGFSGSITNLPRVMTQLYMEGVNDDITGSINNLPPNLQKFFIVSTTHGPKTLSGSINNFPSTLQFLIASGCGTFTGSLQNLPLGINQTLWIDGVGRGITGNVGSLPCSPNNLSLGGLNLTGNLEAMPSTLTGFYLVDNNGGITIGGGSFPQWVGTVDMTIQDGLTTTEVDNFLIGLNTTAPNGTRHITITGGVTPNQARSSASNAAVTALQGKGYTIV